MQRSAGLIFRHFGLKEILLFADVGLLIEPSQPALGAGKGLVHVQLAGAAIGDVTELLEVILDAVAQDRLTE